MFGMCFCLSCAGKQELYGYIQMRPGDDLRLCYQEHDEEYSKKLAVYNLVAGYYFFFLLQSVLLFSFNTDSVLCLAATGAITEIPCFY